MSNDDERDLVPNLSEDRPLDSLMPEMRGRDDGDAADDLHADAPDEVGAIHPRVLEVGLEEGYEWSLACWSDPGASQMRARFGNLVEATLLRKMSRLPVWERDESRRFVAMRLLSFDSLAADSREVLGELGFEEEVYESDRYEERVAAWRQEARGAEIDVPARPVSVWQLPVERSASNAARLEAIASRTLETMGEQVWGETPGALSRVAAREIEEAFGREIELGPEGLERLEACLTVDATDAIRWLEPILAQAICDFVGVVLHGTYSIQVQWGVCEPDPRGVVPAPMFRRPGTGRGETVPIGRRILEWCVMPVSEGEEAPALAERVEKLAARLAGGA